MQKSVVAGHEAVKTDRFAKLCERYSVGNEKTLTFLEREMTTLNRKTESLIKLRSE